MSEKNIWHPVSEKPENYSGWIIESRMEKNTKQRFVVQAFKYDSGIDWENHIKQDKIEEWSYQQDYFEEMRMS